MCFFPSALLGILAREMERFSALSKRNNDQYILSYVREQRQFVKVYAAAGEVERSSWGLSSHSAEHTSTIHNAHVPTLPEFSFGTPVLRSRNECYLLQGQKAVEDNANSRHKPVSIEGQ